MSRYGRRCVHRYVFVVLCVGGFIGWWILCVHLFIGQEELGAEPMAQSTTEEFVDLQAHPREHHKHEPEPSSRKLPCARQAVLLKPPLGQKTLEKQCEGAFQ